MDCLKAFDTVPQGKLIEGLNFLAGVRGGYLNGVMATKERGEKICQGSLFKVGEDKMWGLSGPTAGTTTVSHLSMNCQEIK